MHAQRPDLNQLRIPSIYPTIPTRRYTPDPREILRIPTPTKQTHFPSPDLPRSSVPNDCSEAPSILTDIVTSAHN